MTADASLLCNVVPLAQIFTGFPIAKYFAAHPSRLQGVNLYVPQDGSFPSDESILFFTQIGKVFIPTLVDCWPEHRVYCACLHSLTPTALPAQINFTGSVSNMNVVRVTPAIYVKDKMTPYGSDLLSPTGSRGFTDRR